LRSGELPPGEPGQGLRIGIHGPIVTQ
jgi:hypothetical protein